MWIDRPPFGRVIISNYPANKIKHKGAGDVLRNRKE